MLIYFCQNGGRSDRFLAERRINNANSNAKLATVYEPHTMQNSGLLVLCNRAGGSARGKYRDKTYMDNWKALLQLSFDKPYQI
jgi:hypothetical protein